MICDGRTRTILDRNCSVAACDPVSQSASETQELPPR